MVARLSLAEYVRRELLAGKVLTKFDIQQAYYKEFHVEPDLLDEGFNAWVDPASIGSRIRDLRRAGYKVKIKRVEGHRGVFIYWIKPEDRVPKMEVSDERPYVSE